jgi:hypothetical protein
MTVVRTLRVFIEDCPEGHVRELEATNNFQDPEMGTHDVPLSRIAYIEQ